MSEQSANSQSPRNRGMKIQIWIMLIMVGSVMLAGTLMVPNTEEERERMIGLLGTTNQGALIKPAIDISSALDEETASSLKWKILVAGGQSCDDSCQKVILDTRQVHILMGKLVRRAERVYLADTAQLNGEQYDQLALAHPHLNIQRSGLAELTRLLANSSMDWDLSDTRYIVVTPDNDAILYYTQDDDVMGLLDDLKHLLKYSPDR
jgi:hypothetical protein|tara:strand:- start:8724 stop:9344 length:621 start_codon:yes stop_codon:yes gene_type:complete